MGFFDRFTSRKPESPAATPALSDLSPSGATAAAAVLPRLNAAREKLEAKDLPAALAIYEELLATAGERADVLVAISGDLGTHGHIGEIIELIAPRYDADRHGPATGLNLLQAYLAVRNADAAQHVLDILFTLNRPELEDRLYGFSNAIAELIHERHAPLDPAAPGGVPEGAPKVGLVTLSKPVWFYGLESLAEKILPPKGEKFRRIAFAQLALPGAYSDFAEALKNPEDELGRLSRAIPLWFAETFYFSPQYLPCGAVGVVTMPDGISRAMIFGAEWTTDNLRQLVDTTDGGLDYVFTGALRQQAGDYELTLRLWEVKKFRERKLFITRWTPATVDAELAKVHEQVRGFMEWSPEKSGLPYAAPVRPRAWLDTLGASLGTFLAEKNIVPREQMRVTAESLQAAAQDAGTGESAALAFLTLRARAARAGIDAPTGVLLAPSPLVAEAQRALG